jgi:hypothetical protein
VAILMGLNTSESKSGKSGGWFLTLDKWEVRSKVLDKFLSYFFSNARLNDSIG